MTQFAAGSTLVPTASSPVDRFPQPPYDPTRGGTGGIVITSYLELEGGGYLELEPTVVGGSTQYRPGAVAA